MARIRTIKPELPADEKLGGCSIAARYLFVMLISQADDDGRMRGNPAFVRGSCLPYDDVSLQQVDEWLSELAAGGFLTRYAVEGERYVALNAWHKNQRIDKPRASQIPEPSSTFVEASTNGRGSVGEASCTDMEGERDMEREGEREGERESSAVAVDDESRWECEHLAEMIERNGSKRPVVTKAWLQAADRLKRLDGKTHAQVMACIDWCQADEFWRANILSMPKLRSKFDQLRLAAQRQRRPNGSAVRAAIARGEA